MRDDMKVGDRAFFYHSSCPEPGIAGIVEVVDGRVSRRDAVRRRRASTTTRRPRATRRAGSTSTCTLVEKTRLVALAELRAHPALATHAPSCSAATGCRSRRSTPAEWTRDLPARGSQIVTGIDPLLIVGFVALGCVVGFLAGLLGIGGGMTMVPILTIIFTRSAFPAEHVVHMAVATSTATIIFTSLSSAREHHRHGAVLWPVVAGLAPGIIAGSLVGPQVVGGMSTSALALLLRRVRRVLGDADAARPEAQAVAGAAGQGGACSASAAASASSPAWSAPAAASCRCRSWPGATSRSTTRSRPRLRSGCRSPSPAPSGS